MRNPVRKILAITGIRSEYDLMYPVYKAIDNHENLSLSLIVTGAHLSKNFGYTVEIIKADGFNIVEHIETLIDGDQDISRLKSTSLQLLHLGQTISRIRPDLLLILGDREEALTSAICGTYLNIPIAHISGGDRVIGNADDHIRHAVTKLAHLHFATSEDSKNRILKLGEQDFRVFNVGNPGLDRIAQTPFLSKSAILNYFNFPSQFESSQPLLVLIQHVISTEIKDAAKQMHETLQAVAELGFNTIMSYPNSDAGSREMIDVIESYRYLPNLRIERFIQRDFFINALRHASCLLGNSSLGLLEAPFLKLPVVNIGNRQKARFHVDNVEFITHNKNEIMNAVRKACFNEEYRKYIQSLGCPFGDGNTSRKIVEILTNIAYDKKFFIKDISY